MVGAPVLIPSDPKSVVLQTISARSCLLDAFGVELRASSPLTNRLAAGAAKLAAS